MDDKNIWKRYFWLGVLFLFLFVLFVGGIVFFLIYFYKKIGFLGNFSCIGLLMFGSQYLIKKVDYYFSNAC